MKKKIITGCIAAFVAVVAIIAITFEVKAIHFCTEGNQGECLLRTDGQGWACVVTTGIKECHDTFEKEYLTLMDARP
ncbi:MAG: hypothetical protein FWH23_05630 [Bacteroidales bacterium]|nr:hypothetical protein [Bacteroidales bacterium]